MQRTAETEGVRVLYLVTTHVCRSLSRFHLTSGFLPGGSSRGGPAEPCLKSAQPVKPGWLHRIPRRFQPLGGMSFSLFGPGVVPVFAIDLIDFFFLPILGRCRQTV